MAENLTVDGEVATLADLARAAGVSVPTLRHYFDDREGAVVAALSASYEESYELLQSLSHPGPHALAVSLQTWATRMIDGFRHYGVGALFSGGLVNALGQPTVGPAFVQYVLEPTLGVTERLLAHHRDRGEIDIPDDELRGAALSLTSPLVLALMHQDALFGKTCRPLDLRSFAAQHVDRFLRAYRTSSHS